MATTQEKIAQLRRLIGITHQHGLKLEAEIKNLRAHKPRGWVLQVAGKRALLAGLKALNFRRRVELARLEHKKPPPPPPPPPKPKPPPAQKFTMYDMADAGTRIPTNNPTAVAGYIDGNFRTYHALVARFPHAKHLAIAVFASTNDGHCLDVETGDATPAQAPGWVRKRHAAGIKRPIIYANESTMPAVEAALRNDGIKRDEYMLWVAAYNGREEVPAGFDAHQWKNVEVPGSNYDQSICQPWFL